MAGDRVRVGEYAERVNAAAELAEPVSRWLKLPGCWPSGSAARCGRHAVIWSARCWLGGWMCRRRRRCSPSSSRPGWRPLSARMPVRRGGRSPPWWRRRWTSSWRGPERASAQVSDRTVRRRSSSTATRLRICPRLTPFWCQQRRARIRGGQEGRSPVTSAAIYARVSSARQKKDQTIGSQTAALRAHASQLAVNCPRSGCSRTRGTPGRRWCGPRWSGCATWSPRSASTSCCATRRTAWPASSPIRPC